jgi:carbamoyl-phosphate synthase large subunit
VELINCFREDARDLAINLRVIATDVVPSMSAACQVADAAYAVPRCVEPAFIPRMLELCSAEKVSLVVPTIDTELLVLAEAQERLGSIGTRVLVPSVETVQIARDKLRTVEFLAQHRIPVPRSVPAEQLLNQPDFLRFPVLLKPYDGSSSIGVQSADSAESLERLGLDFHGYLAQEKWIGREYTINQFYDRDGRLRASVPHLRSEVRAGEVSKGVTERHPLLMAMAEKIGTVLPGPRGVLCFQAIVNETGEAIVFEINARFGGGYPLAHRAGARFSRWLLEEVSGIPVTANDKWRAGLTMLRYDAAVFVPPASE